MEAVCLQHYIAVTSFEKHMLPELMKPAVALVSLPSTIVREYDIRGVVDETLTEAHAYAIGRAFATFIGRREGGKTICVARDGRLSSKALQAALVDGLIDAGADVIKLGLGPTPMLYYGTHTLGADGGIMVTGSHNPPSHNGFKMLGKSGSLFGKDILALAALIDRVDVESGEGSLTRKDVKDAYIATLTDTCKEALQHKPLNVAWDAGNGAAGEIMERLCKKLPGHHFAMFAEIDGCFPNHHPDPTVEKNLAALKQKVAAQQCDLGLAFDGDGDRLGVVDHKGRVIWGDQLLVVLARDVLARHPGSPIIADVKASQVLFDEISKSGGKPIMWRTGHSLIKAKMKEEHAPLAGEMSGHIFFADEYFGFDDGLYAAVRLLRIVASLDEALADVIDRLPQTFSTKEHRIECDDEKKFQIVENLRQQLIAEGANVNTIDGVRVLNQDGWWLLRASNTQAALVARCESQSEEGLKRLEEELEKRLSAVRGS
jgi:phosphomannomutase